MKPLMSHTLETKTITDLSNLYNAGQLNLEPGFQRRSVWSWRDRRKLIDSIIKGYPLPAIFLYRRQEAGNIVYDVIDGKQRLESILMFMGHKRGRYELKTQSPENNELVWLDWNQLVKKHQQHLITGCKIPVIEVDGGIGDIIDVFVRINSTGKALTPQEKRHAKYYNSLLLITADKLARRYSKYFVHMGVLSRTQIDRMKHVELITELMLSIDRGDVLNKKTALDKVMSQTGGLNAKQISTAALKTKTALNRIRRMFPKLNTTRLKQVTDFYTLTLLMAKYEERGFVLIDRKRNQLAWDLLYEFAANVDEVRDKQRKAMGIKPEQDVYRDYLMTVSQMTDDINQRQRRERILDSLLSSLFATKDAQRGFTPEQRRIIWKNAEIKRCQSCGLELTWKDFTIDHIHPHSKGGRSEISNAALMHRKCNSSLGNRNSLK